MLFVFPVTINLLCSVRGSVHGHVHIHVHGPCGRVNGRAHDGVHALYTAVYMVHVHGHRKEDLTGMIIGLDWLRGQGEFVWDFLNDRIKFPDEKWIGVNEERKEAVYVRRIYVAEDTVLPSAHQTNVPIRIRLVDKPFVGLIENTKVPSLKPWLQCPIYCMQFICMQ